MNFESPRNKGLARASAAAAAGCGLEHRRTACRRAAAAAGPPVAAQRCPCARGPACPGAGWWSTSALLGSPNMGACRFPEPLCPPLTLPCCQFHLIERRRAAFPPKPALPQQQDLPLPKRCAAHRCHLLDWCVPCLAAPARSCWRSLMQLLRFRTAFHSLPTELGHQQNSSRPQRGGACLPCAAPSQASCNKLRMCFSSAARLPDLCLFTPLRSFMALFSSTYHPVAFRSEALLGAPLSLELAWKRGGLGCCPVSLAKKASKKSYNPSFLPSCLPSLQRSLKGGLR